MLIRRKVLWVLIVFVFAFLFFSCCLLGPGELSKVADPTFSPGSGLFANHVAVNINCTTKGSTILWTTNGGVTWKSGNYVSISETTTLQAKATNKGMEDSDILTAYYTIYPKVLEPGANPSGGIYTNRSFIAVYLSCALADANIEWSTNGGGNWISGTNLILSNNAVLLSRATKSDFTNSDIVTNTYEIVWIGSNLVYTLINSSNEYSVKGGSVTEDVIVPSSWEGKPVTVLETDAFKNWSVLTNVVLPHSLTSVGQSAFYGTALTTIDLPDGVTEIKDDAFGDCTALTNVHFPSQLLSIGESAFYGTALTTIDLPDGVTEIKVYAFGDCTALTNVHFPSQLLSIEESAFDSVPLTTVDLPANVSNIDPAAFVDCPISNFSVDPNNNFYSSSDGILFSKDQSKLCLYPSARVGNYTVPNGVTSIDSYAFYECVGLTNLVFPTSLKTIGERAFQGCEGLTNLDFPSGLTNIGSGAFSSCRGLIHIDLSSNVVFIGTNVFNNCTGLSNLVIPEGVVSVGDHAFSQCYNLTNVVLPTTLTNIEHQAFDSCLYLKNMVFPEGLLSIDSYAFRNCNHLTNVVLPSTLNRIGSGAFSECSRLTNVTVNATTPPVAGTGIFQDCNGLQEIAVPAGSVSAYQSASGWSTYSGKIVSQ